MTALLWMLIWLYVLPAMSDLPQPVNVTLTSDHFIHLLRWSPGPGTPGGVHYNVSVHSESGKSWEPVAGCEHVQHPLVCNLTEAFSNVTQVYYSQVRAVRGRQASKPAIQDAFLPINDTQLDLPLLTVGFCEGRLCVNLQPPVERLKQIYDSLSYSLRVIKQRKADSAEFFKETKSLESVVFEDLTSSGNYCVSVSFSNNQGPRKSNYSRPRCVHTADTDRRMVFLWGFAAVMLVLCIFSQSAVKSLSKTRAPVPVTSIQHREELPFVVPCSPPISFVFIEETAPSAGGKRNSQTLSDEGDGESSAGSGGGAYKLKVPINLLLSAFPSSSSSPFSPEPGALLDSSQSPFSSDCSSSQLQILDPHPEVLNSDSLRNLDEGRLELHHPSEPSNTWNAEGNEAEEEEEEEEEVMGERSGQDVNLLTLTFGERDEEDEEKPYLNRPKAELQSPPVLEESSYEASPLLPVQIWNAQDVAMETVSTFVNEGEEEEYSGYLSRPRS